MKPTSQESATGIPVQAYPATAGYQYDGTPQSEWSTGLCDCMSDVPNCCLTCWCPCITFGQIAEIVDKGSTSCGVSGALYAIILGLTGCQWIYSCTYRSKMRLQFGLPAGTCNDCCTHFWCEPCALCQEHRELQHRGFEPSLGWQGNLAKQNQGVGMTNPPMFQGGMTR
ncbi:Protein CADMIUM RESISTANCE 2 [Dionaea muscipula]